MQAPLPANEGARLEALGRYDLSQLSDTVYHDLTGLAARLCDCPIATITVVEEDCQIFHASVGLSVESTRRDISFCAHAILSPHEVLVVPDATADPRFANNPLVTGVFGLRFYAGVPLVTPDGFAIGSLCVVDLKPRTLDKEQQESLCALGRQVVAQMNLRHHVCELEHAKTALASSSEMLIETNTLLTQVSHRFQELFQGLPIACFCYDKEGRIYEWNRACEGVYGWDVEDVLQKTLYDAACAPENIPTAEHIVAQVFAGHSFQGLEWAERCPDGSVRHLLSNTFPLRCPDGHVIGAINTSVDITARKAAEDACRRSEQALLTAYDSMEQSVRERTQQLADANGILREQIAERLEAENELQCVLVQSEQLLASIASILIGVNEQGVVTAWNASAQRSFGLASADILDRPFMDCGINWDWARVQTAIRDCLDSGQAGRLDDVRYTRQDGQERFLGMGLNPIHTFAGGAAGFLLLATDVTDRKVLESQLAQAQRLESLGQLAAGIAHEINTPIQYVGDNIRFLQDGFGDLDGLLDAYAALADAARLGTPVPPEMLQATDKAVVCADLDYLRAEIPSAIAQSLEGVGRVAHIVRAMKDFSHPGTAQKTAIDLGRALDSTLTVARNEWKYVADLHTDFDPSLPPVPCLPEALNQVFLNMIINASHAIGDMVGDRVDSKGTLSVSTRRAGEWAEVRIADSGTGIPASVRAKIFDPFFTTKEVGKGTGQGLAISHAVVVEKHGGTIDVETEVGKGTVFIIRLPLSEDAVPQTALPEAA